MTGRYGTGCRPDRSDRRDYPIHQLTPPRAYGAGFIKPYVDLRSQQSPVRNQGELGSCTGMALCALRECLEIQACQRMGKPVVWTLLSPLDLYYWERVAEGHTMEDAGAMIRTGLQVLLRAGVCPEVDAPYNPELFCVPSQPPAAWDATAHCISNYYRIFTLDQLKRTLSWGHSAVIGFQVFESIESDQCLSTGEIPYPKQVEQFYGGHAVLAVGYDSRRGQVLIKNSWGAEVGQQGYFWLPFSYWEETTGEPSLVVDMWTAVTEETKP